MAKRVIRLTEADVEKIVRQVIEEQKRSDPLRPKKRKNNDKTDRNASNWNGGNSGTLNFPAFGTDTVPAILAVNVGPNRYNIRSVTKLGKLIQPITPQQDDDVTLEEFNIAGLSLPYADNMVKPYFEKYPDAQTVFNDIVRKFVRYIKAGGGPKLTNVTIKGSADSARPTLDVPSGYSQLDHPDSKPYNGETDPFKMNQYLADKRAEEYANVLKSDIKEQTGFDLTITVLPGENYYGQEGKRGEEYRKITLSPNAETLKITNPSQTTTPDNRNEISAIPYRVEYYKDGNAYEARGYNVVIRNGVSFPAIPKEKAESWNTPYFNGKMNSEIEDNKFYVDGNLVGIIKPKGDDPVESIFTTFGLDYSKWVGPITVLNGRGTTVQIEGEGEVNVVYLKTYCFLFQ